MPNNKTKYFSSYLFLVYINYIQGGWNNLTAVSLQNTRIYYKINLIYSVVTHQNNITFKAIFTIGYSFKLFIYLIVLSRFLKYHMQLYIAHCVHLKYQVFTALYTNLMNCP